jgi:hypothetical protein
MDARRAPISRNATARSTCFRFPLLRRRWQMLARAGRSSPGDAEDIAFLEARRAKP